MGIKYQVQPKFYILDGKGPGEIVDVEEKLKEINSSLEADEEPIDIPGKISEWESKGAISPTFDPTIIPSRRVDWGILNQKVRDAGLWQVAYQKAKSSPTVSEPYRALVSAVEGKRVTDFYFFGQDLLDEASTAGIPFTASEISTINGALDAAGLIGNLVDPNE